MIFGRSLKFLFSEMLQIITKFRITDYYVIFIRKKYDFCTAMHIFREHLQIQTHLSIFAYCISQVYRFCSLFNKYINNLELVNYWVKADVQNKFQMNHRINL